MKGETEQTNYGTYVEHLVSVTAPDDATVVMTTDVPTPIMTTLDMPILPEHVWKDVSEKEVGTFDNEKNVVGSGPSSSRSARRASTSRSGPTRTTGAVRPRSTRSCSGCSTTRTR
jgi:hypothetical protein